MVEVGSWVTSTNLHNLHRPPPSLTVAILLPMPDLLAARSQLGVSLAFTIVFAFIGFALPFMLLLGGGGWRWRGPAFFLVLARRGGRGRAFVLRVAPGL